MQVLDPCCGGKMFWFDKENPNVLFGDCREERYVLCDGRTLNVAPDQVLDFRALPFDPGVFNLVCFDPPHLKSAGPESWMRKKFGCLDPETWRSDLKTGFEECWRVLAPGGTLIFKWNETQIKISELLECFPARPLFGHTTTQNLKTHWMVFYKPANEAKIQTKKNGVQHA